MAKNEVDRYENYRADDYQGNIYPQPYRAVILAVVVVGLGEKLYRDSPERKAPSEGYHSVLGEVGKDLNYDEVVVYRNDAIRPAWLVIYDLQ
ncbi:hypothetical protein FRB99_001285 [Tulasnella sp. 403]|nr:hypothetical protein FRB99_001285 [Tulasnella sp. 403]